MRNGRGSPTPSWTGPAWHPLGMTWRCAGWRSGTPRITSTWWSPWPGRTRSARRSGTTTSVSGRRARTRSASSACVPPHQQTAPRRAGPTRAESERTIRPGWDEPPRTRLRPRGPHHRGRSMHRAGVLHPPGPGRGPGPPPVQHGQPRPGHRLRRRPAGAHRPGRPPHLVRRREARCRPDAAQAAHPVVRAAGPRDSGRGRPAAPRGRPCRAPGHRGRGSRARHR
jgi:hypothetical protein